MPPNVGATEVPDEMSACLDCDAVQCSYERYNDCTNLLAMAAALQTRRTQDSESPGDVDESLAESTSDGGCDKGHIARAADGSNALPGEGR